MKYNEVIEERAETANFMQGGKNMGRRKKSIVWMAAAVFLVTAGFDASGQDVKPSAEIAALPEDETEELSRKKNWFRF